MTQIWNLECAYFEEYDRLLKLAPQTPCSVHELEYLVVAYGPLIPDKMCHMVLMPVRGLRFLILIVLDVLPFSFFKGNRTIGSIGA